MLWEAMIINDHSKCEDTYTASKAYLETNPDLHERLSIHLRAYDEIGDLIPQTLDNILSGHYFPYSESYYELENSYELALQGFYTYAFVALRSVLELGLLGVYFAVHDTEHVDVRPWMTSQERTPRRKEIFHRLRELVPFEEFNRQFDFEKRILDTFDNLDRFVHTRGYRYSSSALTLSNFNQFSDKSLRRYCDSMVSVVTDLIIAMLLKYPIGMQELFITEKFGLNGPVGGFFEAHQVTFVTSLVHPDERAFLQRLSGENPDVEQTVEYFRSLPDLTEEEWQRQAKQQRRDYGGDGADKKHKKHDGVYQVHPNVHCDEQ